MTTIGRSRRNRRPFAFENFLSINAKQIVPSLIYRSVAIAFAVMIVLILRCSAFKASAQPDKFQRENSTRGYLSTHVLDTTSGLPASGMRIKLHRLSYGKSISSGERHLLGEYVTNSDGRVDENLLEGDEFVAGTYELTFGVADYFERERKDDACNVDEGGNDEVVIPFLSEVPIRFGVSDVNRHYHVPLLVTPFSYSTYRGS